MDSQTLTKTGPQMLPPCCQEVPTLVCSQLLKAMPLQVWTGMSPNTSGIFSRRIQEGFWIQEGKPPPPWLR